MQQKQVGMASQLNELMNCIHQVDFNLQIEQIPNRVLLLLGQTRAGKTTLLYYLLKKKLLLEVNQQLNLTLMKAQVQYFNAKIGNNYDSTTVYPNIPSEYDDDCLVIDMPGFNDTRPLFRLLNIYIIQETIKKIKNVHVSIVIPFENLEGQALLTALENTCNLLNNDFLKADHCTSFILTKIQDISYDKEIFDEQMKSLQEYYQGGPIADVLTNFEDMNTYIFSKEEPKPEEGGLLKERILRENKFYKIDEDPSNLLCQRYADVIIGKGNLQEFKLYILRILREIVAYLPLLIQLFGELVKFHHFDLLKECLSWQQEAESVKKSIQKIINKLPLGQLNENDIELVQKQSYPNRVEQILALISKLKCPPENEDPELTQILGDISHFLPYSQLFSREESGVCQKLRTTVHLAFKNSLLILRTIGAVRDEQITKNLRDVSLDEGIKSASIMFRNIFQEERLAKSLSTMAEAHQLAVTNSYFKEFILTFNPDFSPPDQVIKIVQIKTHDRLKNHKWQHAVLQTSKSTHEPTQQVQKQTHNIVILTPKNIAQTPSLHAQLSAMSSTKASLEMVLKSIRQLSEKRPAEKVFRQYYSQLWRKAVSILSDLRLFEEALLFSLGIPDEVEAEKLIDTAIRFQQLSDQFTEQVLIPYYSNITFGFERLQKLINYLSVRALDRSRLLSLQKKYATILVQMRKKLQEKNLSLDLSIKRFNLGFVAHLLGSEGRSDMLQRAEINCKKLMKSKLLHQSMKNHLLKLRNGVQVL